jgi:Bacterial protein of unknown function (Gcw_chp)
VVGVGVQDAGAQAISSEGPASNVTSLFTTDVVSQDVFRGTFLGGPSIEPSLDFSNGTFDLGEWSNSTVSNRVQGPSSTEIELYGSYTFPTRGSLSLAPGFTLYALPWGPGFGDSHRSSIEPSLALIFSAGALRLSPTVYDDLVLRVLTLEANATYAHPLKGARTELDFTATLGAEKSQRAPAGVRAWSTYWLLGVAAPFKVGKTETLTVAWSCTGILRNESSAFGFAGGSESALGFVTLSFAVKF